MDNCGKPRKRIFLSGLIDGKNRACFSEAAIYLRGQGFQVFNPAFNAQGSLISNLHELTEHMDGRAYYDAIAQLPNWDKSQGAKVEYLIARACGIKVIAV